MTDDELDESTRLRLAAVAADRAAVYELLVVGLAEPDDEQLAALQRGSMTHELEARTRWLREDAALYQVGLDGLRAAETQVAAAPSLTAVLRDYKVEYARLFTGPGRPVVACYESQYRDEKGKDGWGRLEGPSTEAVRQAYRAAGVALAPDMREPADHVLTELEFLYYLCRAEAEAWAAGNGAPRALELRRATDTFLREHAVQWMPVFADAVKGAATLPLPAALADVLLSHLAVELGEVPDQLRRRAARAYELMGQRLR